MSNKLNTPFLAFQSCMAPWFRRFIQEKRALGFKYVIQSFELRRLDRLLIKEEQKTEELPQPIVKQWLKPCPYLKPVTRGKKLTIARQLALFLIRNEVPAYLISAADGKSCQSTYTPRIFSHNEIQKLLTVTDSLPFRGQAPFNHRIIPEIFRLLYGCGLRVSEVAQLQVQDVDLTAGVLTIREAKGGNDRLVPMAHSIKERLKRYVEIMGERPSDSPFFPTPDGEFHSRATIYCTFRKLLRRAGIPHGGRGHGPRLHDLRHTFAVHRLIRWYREGTDLNAKLPVLSTYLGHRLLVGTQRYLHLTAEIFPDLNLAMESAVGYVIPRRDTL